MGSITPQPLSDINPNHQDSSSNQSCSNPTFQPPERYWQINAPPSSPYHPLHPSHSSSPFYHQCPPFLVNLPPKDLATISTPNASYKLDTWPQVVKRVKENRLADFQRTPGGMWRYLEFCWGVKEEWGSVKRFILEKRLKWDLEDERFEPGCEERGDVKILWNDWPYGIDERIVHLVVWTRFELEDDPATGDLTDEARKEIDEYVKRTFGKRVKEEHIIWFKNWAHIKSVKAVEHFHVMLFDPDPEFVREITNGDVPLGIIQTKTEKQ
ncbi:hypothetical protein B0T20DRAFT_487423 [Sordaria brevicollis]|uniref:N-acetylglucosamine-induced protein 1 n=1 Tax=Sordaria brevicollis TaxID=83679 RepID=A0AAE0U9X6_SORBR|nr:hypothetical protein B0T20DRAFT_487423 [Sordaria brevicollis]